MLVKEFVDKKVDGFPLGFYECLPTVCSEPDCGYPTEMYETLTGLRCSNPRCPAKVSQRLQAMFTSLGVKGVGEVGFRSIVEYWGLRNPLLLLQYEFDGDGVLAPNINEATSREIERQLKEHQSFTLAEYVRLANIPALQTSSNAIFDKFDDIIDAYNAIEEGGIEYIQERLGIAKADLSLRSVKVYESLMTFKDDLIEGFDCIDVIRKNSMLTFKVCVSQAVECGFKTKAEFYNYVNNLAPGRLYVEFIGSATGDIDYLVWAGREMSRKVSTVQRRNESGGNVPILNATEFIEEMKRKL